MQQLLSKFDPTGQLESGIRGQKKTPEEMILPIFLMAMATDNASQENNEAVKFALNMWNKYSGVKPAPAENKCNESWDDVWKELYVSIFYFSYIFCKN